MEKTEQREGWSRAQKLSYMLALQAPGFVNKRTPQDKQQDLLVWHSVITITTVHAIILISLVIIGASSEVRSRENFTRRHPQCRKASQTRSSIDKLRSLLNPLELKRNATLHRKPLKQGICPDLASTPNFDWKKPRVLIKTSSSRQKID